MVQDYAIQHRQTLNLMVVVHKPVTEFQVYFFRAPIDGGAGVGHQLMVAIVASNVNIELLPIIYFFLRMLHRFLIMLWP